MHLPRMFSTSWARALIAMVRADIAMRRMQNLF